MFSYLRPHHKRTSSNPSSPADPSQSFEPHPQPDHGHPQRQQDASFPEQPTRPAPPLPPIVQLSSANSNIDDVRREGFERETRTYFEASRSSGRSSESQTTSSNRHRMQYGGTKRPDSAGNPVSTGLSSSQFSRQPTGMSSDTSSRYTSTNSSSTFIGTAESQNKIASTGRRPDGSRLPSPPPSSSNTYSTFEPAPARSSKTRLNLLNPMSLLARRRTPQAVTQLSPGSLVSRRSNFSETFDPRIRGTVVHDFSAPRAPKRIVSYKDAHTEKPTIPPSKNSHDPNGEINIGENVGSPWSGGNHTPVFTENFEDEQYPAAGPHVRKANDLTDLPLPKPPYAKGAQKLIEQSSARKGSEPTQLQTKQTKSISVQKPMPERPPPVPPKSEGRGTAPQDVSIGISSALPQSVSKKGHPRNVSEVLAKDAAIPKHMKSTSSRFSFDMIGAAEQERLLEDRHRQRALEKKAENAENDERMEDEFDDEYDYDETGDDGLEERIPGVNADLVEEDEYTYEFPNSDENLGGFTFQQSTLASPMSPASPGMVSTPRDANGEVIGFAMTKNSPYLSLGLMQDSIASPTSPATSDVKNARTLSANQGLGLQGIGLEHRISSGPDLVPPDDQAEEFPRPVTLDDDDLYFDDGIICEPPAPIEEGNFEFDESVFDNIDTDEYGRPLKPVPAPLPTLYEPPVLAANPLPSLSKIAERSSEEDTGSPDLSITSPKNGGLALRPSVLGKDSMLSATHGLTQDTLAAYQSALAAAAFTAAANGKFRRDSTPPDAALSDEDDHPGLVNDSSQASHYDTFSPSYELEDDFDYDDALEDDAIIAAANAEALANDCDGFYGQEFGFYSAPAAGEAEYANGGYLGPRGVEGIGRSQSGRVASREPNLTPITERSEYSNRNSFMSLSMHNLASSPSPGLAQIAGMLRSPTDYDGDMSLDALLKLRRGAWGGSQASLHSSNGSPRSPIADDSPVAQIPPWAQGGAVTNPVSSNFGLHRRKNSAFSLGSENASAINTGVNSEVSTAPASPTLTMSISAAPEKVDENSKDRDRDSKFRKHRYTGSSESVSYSKEDDPVTGERWVLERRRTADSGEIELLGREIVSGGRI